MRSPLEQLRRCLLATVLLSGTSALAFVPEPIPPPDLSAMAEPVRREIERLADEVETLAGREGVEAGELGRAYTMLGEVYQAHSLPNAAAIAYSNATHLDPDNPLPIFHQGRLHRDQGNWPEAAASFERVLALDSEDHTARLLLGEVQLDLQNTEAAEQSFRLVLAAEPDSAAAHFGLGKAVAAQGRTEEAIGHYTRALELQPDAALVHYSLALAYRSMRDLDRARAHLEQWSDEPPRLSDPRLDRLSRIAALSAVGATLDLAGGQEDFSARDFLGFTVDQLGETSGAVELLAVAAEAREADPSPASAREAARIHFAIGGLLAYRGDDDEAIEHFRSATEILPQFEEALLELGDAHARSGDFAAADAAYDRVLAIDPDNPGALLRRATAAVRQGQNDRAFLDLERVTELDPASATGWFHLAALEERRSSPGAAISAYERALDLGLSANQQSFAHQRLGALLRQRGAIDGALGHYQEALRIDEEATDARFELAALLGRLDRFDEAAREFGRVVAARPDHEAARLAEVSALVFAGRWQEAGQRLESGHQALAESRNLTHLLARFLAATPDTSRRDGARARELAEPLFAARRSLFVGETLAMALAESGDTQRAAELQQSLLAAARNAGVDSAADRMQANLVLYQEGKACCARRDAVGFLPPLESSPPAASSEPPDRQPRAQGP